MRVTLTAAVAVATAAFGIAGGAVLLSRADAQPPGLPNAPGSGQALAAWEYKFVDVRNDRKEFERSITAHGREGWEFCSSERFGQSDIVLVFKKRGGNPPAGTMPGGTVPAVGDTPALSFRRADGKDGSLADYRGKYTLVHFWSIGCPSCKKQLPAVLDLHERFGPRGLVTLGLSLDEDDETWLVQAALLRGRLKGQELPWSQGFLAGGAAGVSSVPAYWLLEPHGRLVAKSADPGELAKELEGRLKLK